MPPGLPLSLPRSLAFRGSPGPCSLAQVLVSTPLPHPQGPLPVPTSLFGFITLGGKGETFPFRPVWEKGSLRALGRPGTSKAHLLLQATPPAPPPSSHAYQPHPAGTEPRDFQASGLSGKEQKGS